MKTLKDLVESGLRAGGYDGLYNSAANCSCRLSDRPGLFPCGEPSEEECKAGYAGPCDGTCDDPPCEGHVFGRREDAEVDLRPLTPKQRRDLETMERTRELVKK